MATYHGVRESSWYSNQHPPDNSHEELLPVAFDQRLDNSTIHRSDLHRDQRPHDQEEAMTDQQSRLLAPPTGDNDAHQLQQAPEELPVELDPLLLLSEVLILLLAFAAAGAATLGAFGSLTAGDGLLLGDSIAHSVDEGDEEGQVDGAGDAGAVLQVERGELGNDGTDGALALAWAREGRQGELRLGRHGGLLDSWVLLVANLSMPSATERTNRDDCPLGREIKDVEIELQSSRVSGRGSSQLTGFYQRKNHRCRIMKDGRTDRQTDNDECRSSLQPSRRYASHDTGAQRRCDDNNNNNKKERRTKDPKFKLCRRDCTLRSSRTE